MICTLALTWGARTMSSKAANTHAGFPAGRCVELSNTFRHFFRHNIPYYIISLYYTIYSIFFSSSIGISTGSWARASAAVATHAGVPQGRHAAPGGDHDTTFRVQLLVVWECANHVWTCLIYEFYMHLICINWVFSCLFDCNGVWMEIANHSESLEWKEKLIQLLRRREAGQLLWPIRSCPNVTGKNPGAKWDEPWKEPWLDQIDCTSVTSVTGRVVRWC